jgi:hypothetical protein
MRFIAIALALVATAAAVPTDTLFGRTTCSTPEGPGTCEKTSACKTTKVAGHCPGAADIECCVKAVFNAKITRAEIIARGELWIKEKVPYSMTKTHADAEGAQYRTDCSGFVSMALHITPPGLSTVTLPQVAKKIAWNDLQPGDFVGTLGAGTGGADGHVTLFHSWVSSAKKEYNTLECRGTAFGCVAFKRPVGWKDGSHTSAPYRYIHVE